jgi:hypothetical protein
MPHPIKVSRFTYILLHEDTTLVRLFFGLGALLMALTIGMDEDFKYFHENSLRIAPQWGTALMFFLHGTALVYGAITSKFNRWLLILEGMVGTFVWSAMAYTDFLDHGGITPVFIGACMAFLLLVRYPTHYTPPHRRTDDDAQ